MLGLAFTGCKEFARPAVYSESLSSQCAVKPSLKTKSLAPTQSNSVFAAHKIHKSTRQGDEKWILLVDNNCLIANQDLQSRIGQMPIRDLQFQAYQIDVQDSMAEQLAQQECVKGASLESPLRAFQLPQVAQNLSIQAVGQDPMAANQEHLSFLRWFDKAADILRVNLADKTPIIAIVDTGIDYNHEDLRDVMWRKNGTVGFDVFDNDTDPMDENGHGTHVAGLAAASNQNAVGVAGVGKAQLMAVRVLDATGTTSTQILVNGILWAVDQGADVINLSVGSNVRDYSVILREALNYALSKNVVVIAAAGNENRLLSETVRVEPAGLGKDLNGMITVGSLDTSTGRKSLFSNYSPEYIEMMAPGAVRSSTIAAQNVGLLSTFWANPIRAYERLPGTSMASPLVAGAAALVIGKYRQENAAYTNAQIELDLKSLSRKSADLTASASQGMALDIQSLQVFVSSQSTENSDSLCP